MDTPYFSSPWKCALTSTLTSTFASTLSSHHRVTAYYLAESVVMESSADCMDECNIDSRMDLHRTPAWIRRCKTQPFFDIRPAIPIEMQSLVPSDNDGENDQPPSKKPRNRKPLHTATMICTARGRGSDAGAEPQLCTPCFRSSRRP